MSGGTVEWSGQNWYWRGSLSVPSIVVIEKPAESYDAYHQRKTREEQDGKPKRVPFGFSRVLEEPEE